MKKNYSMTAVAVLVTFAITALFVFNRNDEGTAVLRVETSPRQNEKIKPDKITDLSQSSMQETGIAFTDARQQVTSPGSKKNTNENKIQSSQKLLSNDPAVLTDFIIEKGGNDRELRAEAVQKLISLALNESTDAVSQLHRLSNTMVNGETGDSGLLKLLHPVLQTLGHIGGAEANEALLYAIKQSSRNPIETVRMLSYLPPGEDGFLESDVVDELMELAVDQSLFRPSRRTIIDTIKDKGGKYGMIVVREAGRIK